MSKKETVLELLHKFDQLSSDSKQNVIQNAIELLEEAPPGMYANEIPFMVGQMVDWEDLTQEQAKEALEQADEIEERLNNDQWLGSTVNEKIAEYVREVLNEKIN